MKRFRLLVLLWLLAPGQVVAADDSFWCGQRIVRVGDPVWQVARRCPEPFWRETLDRPVLVGRHGQVLRRARVEVWTLNFGSNRFMRQLDFVDGRLARVHELGYGVSYEPGSRRCDALELGQAGETSAEIYARCGPPDYRYELSDPAPWGFGGFAAPDAGERYVWTYDFGGRQRPRELHFLDGRLRRIEMP